jgi:Holliday junction resolvase
MANRKKAKPAAPKKRINSRNKGASAERELANLLRERGYDAARGQQHKGGTDSPDVVGLPGIHIECKRVQAGNLYNWLAQAIKDAGADKVPVVVHRRNGKRWVAILDLDAFLNLLVFHPL